jgi:hypothetical protein
MPLSRLAIAFLLAPIPASGKDSPTPAPVPSPALTPERVVEIQLDALRRNDLPEPDAGIATAFRFASPGNRRTTGPVERFALIVKSPAYRPMIGHRIAGYGPMKVNGDRAACRVKIVAADGKAHDYEFRLSKDPASACWFTDGVLPFTDKPQIDEGKVA